jgi:predicted alpha/beta-hydrolase family hydrolase
MLFVQGSRDTFGTPEELAPIVARLGPPTQILVVEGGDHSLAVPKSSGSTQEEVFARVQDEVVNWIRARSG